MKIAITFAPGVFDYGISDAFIHDMPPGQPDINKYNELKGIFKMVCLC